MIRHLLCLTLDTDPDGTTGRGQPPIGSSFRGLCHAQALPLELEKLGTQLGQPVPVTWFIRVDRHIEKIFGSPVALLAQFEDFWTACRKRGDETAWHPHLGGNQGSSRSQNRLTSAQASEELEGLWEIVRHTSAGLASFRNGEAWHTPQTYATIERFGFRCDSTIIPGREGGGMFPADWTLAPNCPYYPAADDLCSEGTERPLLELPLNSWQTQATYDQGLRTRYMNPSVHEAVFTSALALWRSYLLKSAQPLNVWTLVIHPDEFTPGGLPDSLYAHSVDSFSRNLLNMTECLRDLRHDFEFVTMAEAAESWRCWQRADLLKTGKSSRKENFSATSALWR